VLPHGRLAHEAAPQAPRAGISPLGFTIYKGPNALKVRKMPDFRLDVRVADFISNHRFLFAKSANSSHVSPLSSAQGSIENPA
jgi:hypothetical protein